MFNPYETERLVAEYLFFHYADEEEVSGGHPIPREALNFPVRLISELADPVRSPRTALDLGCAVGRASFELTRLADSVIGGRGGAHHAIHSPRACGHRCLPRAF